MSTEQIKEKESLFSPKNIKTLINPFNSGNPIIVLILGICPALAVTAKVKPAFVMSLSVIVVLAASNVVISFMRNTVPPRIRIIVQLVVIATMVILVDLILKAYVYDISKQLSVFVGLIITNCIIMGRLEAFAMANKPWPAFLDGIGNGFGFGMILVMVAIIRELFGAGTLWDFQVIPQAVYDAGYVNNGLMILPPMALVTVGVFIWIHRSKNKDLIENN